MNPAITLMFFRLGKIVTWDAVFYVCFQFIGGLVFSLAILGRIVKHPGVNFAAPHVPAILFNL